MHLGFFDHEVTFLSPEHVITCLAVISLLQLVCKLWALNWEIITEYRSCCDISHVYKAGVIHNPGAHVEGYSTWSMCVCLSVCLSVSLSACLLVLIYHLEQLRVQQEVLMASA